MIPVLRSPLLAAVPGLVHGHSTRAHGSLGRGRSDARDGFLRSLGADPASIVVPHQVHGGTVEVCEPGHAGSGRGDRPPIAACDGLVSAATDVSLFAQGADCPLLLLAPSRGGAVSVVHSGWRGTVARIGSEAVDRLAGLGHPAHELVAAVFPGIGACCFEVGPDVVEEFRHAFGPRADHWVGGPAPGRPADRRRLDLRAALRATLVESGIPDRSVEDVAGCTVCGDLLWSHRRSGGRAERHALVAFLA